MFRYVEVKPVGDRPGPAELAPEQQAFCEDVEWFELHLQVLEEQAGVTPLRLVLNGDVGLERHQTGGLLTRQKLKAAETDRIPAPSAWLQSSGAKAARNQERRAAISGRSASPGAHAK